jgi:hypothetical protein
MYITLETRGNENLQILLFETRGNENLCRYITLETRGNEKYLMYNYYLKHAEMKSNV